MANHARSHPKPPRARICRLAGEIHQLGPRPLCELFVELADGRELVPALERYARLAPLAGFISAHGGRELTRARVVRGRR